jgi:hypothetical protein
MTLRDNDIISGGFHGGIAGGPSGPRWSIKWGDLDQLQRTAVSNLVDALTTNQATYNEPFIGDIGCSVSVNGKPVFETGTFTPIPDQYLQLRELVESVASPSRGSTRPMQGFRTISIRLPENSKR